MDVNDIHVRLARMYAAVGALVDTDVRRHTRIQRITAVKLGGEVVEAEGAVCDFRGRSPSEAQNLAMQAIELTIRLKDHLKKCIKNHGGTASDVEELVNNSAELSIALDLWNKDKHGDPLERPPRSHHDPRLTDLHRVCTVGGGSGMSYITFGSAGMQSGGSVGTRVAGSVVDRTGNVVVSLTTLVERCVSQLEAFMTSRNEIPFPECE